MLACCPILMITSSGNTRVFTEPWRAVTVHCRVQCDNLYHFRVISTTKKQPWRLNPKVCYRLPFEREMRPSPVDRTFAHRRLHTGAL